MNETTLIPGTRPRLTFESLERLVLRKPVDRLAYIEMICRDKAVLDIGCLDETALAKRETEHWLHGRIARVAKSVLGIDASSRIPDAGIQTGPQSIIVRGDGVEPSASIPADSNFDLVVAGEFIEHLEQPIEFLRNMRRLFPGSELILSTPNGACFANCLMGAAGREVQHPDHLANFTYKILNTLCLRAQLSAWEIIPYRFYATEMILDSRGMKRLTATTVQQVIRGVEWMFPLLSFGYIVRAKL